MEHNQIISNREEKGFAIRVSELIRILINNVRIERRIFPRQKLEQMIINLENTIYKKEENKKEKNKKEEKLQYLKKVLYLQNDFRLLLQQILKGDLFMDNNNPEFLKLLTPTKQLIYKIINLIDLQDSNEKKLYFLNYRKQKRDRRNVLSMLKNIKKKQIYIFHQFRILLNDIINYQHQKNPELKRAVQFWMLISPQNML